MIIITIQVSKRNFPVNRYFGEGDISTGKMFVLAQRKNHALTTGAFQLQNFSPKTVKNESHRIPPPDGGIHCIHSTLQIYNASQSTRDVSATAFAHS
ncbi:MAG: hypothetical protein C4527_08600 [Candidatus Omnitrophota bacterium]|nr:MAG: hypothetical protein C4527_08600 [Candidatus Omnitrophota bacterium]